MLRAVCALPAGVLLTGDVLLLGADAEQLLLTDGPEAIAAAEHLAPGMRKRACSVFAALQEPSIVCIELPARGCHSF